jgi:hypothetical protein
VALVFWGLCALVRSAEAKEIRYKDYALEIREGDRLVISAIKGSVKLTPTTEAKVDGKRALVKARKTVVDKPGVATDLLTKFDALSFNVRREGTAVLVEVRGPDSKASWAQWLKGGMPEMHFELEVPQIPVEISLHEGQINVSNWRQGLALSLVSGSVKSVGTEGFLKLQIQRGQVAVDRHRGSLHVDSFSAKVNIQDLEGDLGLSNFSGDTALAKVKGSLELNSNAGSTSIIKSTGALDFVNGQGALTASGFEGPVRGLSEQGAVNLTIEGDAEVRVESNQGSITVKLPANSGSQVRMQTDEGVLSAPDAIKSAGAHIRLLNARLPGGGPKGSVAIKSKAGALRVRI